MDRFVDEAVEQFAHDHTEPETALYRRLREETYRAMNLPQMQVGLIEGRFLKMLVRLTGARTVLKIGMFTGYSALMMAEGLPEDGHLITCEIDPKAEGKPNWVTELNDGCRRKSEAQMSSVRHPVTSDL